MNNKIKILHVYRSMNRGGSETFIMNVMRNIKREEIQFDFLCTANEIGVYDSEIEKMGGKIIHYDSFCSKNPIKVIRDTIKIIKLNGPYDGIHIPLQFYSGFYCLAAKKCNIKKIIVHSHSAGDKKKNLFRLIYMKIMRIIIDKYSNIKLACGNNASNYLFGTTNNVKIIYNGINLEKFENVDKKEVKKLIEKYDITSQIIIGHIGRFADVKNHKFFIQIAKTLKERNIDFKIIFVGDGPNFDSIKKIVSQNSLDNYFIFAGGQSDTPLYYSLFDVFVMPSLYEGFPISAVEALATGVPCVLSNTITDEVNIIKNSCSFLDLNDSINKWCDEIVKLSRNKLDKEKNCKILEKKGFSIDSTVKELVHIYREDS